MNEQQLEWLGRARDLFMRYGMRSVTMDDIARELGISKKTLYQFVSSKDELVEQVVLSHIKEEKLQSSCIMEESENAVEEMLKVTELIVKDSRKMKNNVVFDLQRYFHAAWRHVEAYQQEFMVSHIQANIERGIREGLYRQDLDPKLNARLHVLASFTLFDERWFPPSEYPLEKIIKAFYIQYLYGLVSDKGRALLNEKLS